MQGTGITSGLGPGRPRRWHHLGVDTEVIPILHVADVRRAVEWYALLGFAEDWEHRFEPGLPAYVQVGRDGAHLHLSEHTGDARPGTLIYVWVADVDAVARAVGLPPGAIDEMDWGRDFEVKDPDGNRTGWRAGTPDGRALCLASGDY